MSSLIQIGLGLSVGLQQWGNLGWSLNIFQTSTISNTTTLLPASTSTNQKFEKKFQEFFIIIKYFIHLYYLYFYNEQYIHFRCSTVLQFSLVLYIGDQYWSDFGFQVELIYKLSWSRISLVGLTGGWVRSNQISGHNIDYRECYCIYWNPSTSET